MRIKSAVAIAALVTASLAATHAQQPAPQNPPASQPLPQPQQQRSLVPDTFTNLQVLPKDIAKADLVRIMKSISRTMERRCNFCHVATDDLSQADFASDEKETKRKARELLQFILETQKKPTGAPPAPAP